MQNVLCYEGEKRNRKSNVKRKYRNNQAQKLKNLYLLTYQAKISQV